MYLFFFFKQKTAYEMRISDWSSDVCSSDLRMSEKPTFMNSANARVEVNSSNSTSTPKKSSRITTLQMVGQTSTSAVVVPTRSACSMPSPVKPKIGRASCRERGCQYV